MPGPPARGPRGSAAVSSPASPSAVTTPALTSTAASATGSPEADGSTTAPSIRSSPAVLSAEGIGGVWQPIPSPTMTTIRAAVLEAVGGELEVQELDLAPPRAGEVQVRLLASGVC